MRKIEQDMISALVNREEFKRDNTRVIQYVSNGPFTVEIHGNKIAEYWPASGKLTIWDGNHQTNTTKSRLNALLGRFSHKCAIVQRNWSWFICEDVGDRHSWIPWMDGAIIQDGKLKETF